MPELRLADVIVPDFFNPYVVQRTMEKSDFFQSGIIVNSPEFDMLASQAAPTVNMPFFSDLQGESEQVVEDVNLNAAKMACKKDMAPIIRMGKMWSATDLSASLSGVDPMGSVADLVADFWRRDMQKELLAILAGVFKSTTLATNKLDISARTGDLAKISPEAFIDATQLLGDASQSLGAVVMHSAVKAYLRKKNLIETIRPSDSSEFDVYQGVRVIVDDGCTVNNGVYRSYLFGEGAIAFGNGSPVGFVSTELDRDRKKGSGVDYIISRRTFLLHPRGVKFTGANVALPEGPSRVELGDGSNWERVFESKQVKIVAFDYKIG